ncbi:unnamed protein product [Urochloa humidicola]
MFFLKQWRLNFSFELHEEKAFRLQVDVKDLSTTASEASSKSSRNGNTIFVHATSLEFQHDAQDCLRFILNYL